MTLASPDGARRAALLLHALPPDDRQALLDELPASARDALAPLLAELAALGFPADPALVRAAIDMPAPTGPIERLRALDPAAVRALGRRLSSEPAGLVAAFLSAADWPWRQDLVAALAPEQRAALAPVDLPPSLREALLQAVADAAEAERVSKPDAASGMSATRGLPPRGVRHWFASRRRARKAATA